jgi:hypothetical protein
VNNGLFHCRGTFLVTSFVQAKEVKKKDSKAEVVYDRGDCFVPRNDDTSQPINALTAPLHFTTG